MVLDRRPNWAGIGIYVSLAVFWIIVCLLVAFVFTAAHAQSSNMVWSERSSSAPYGIVYPMWNATGSTIPDGTIVMTDTTGTTVQPQVVYGKGFKTFDSATGNVKRIVGVLLGDCPGYSYGRVMAMGFHNHMVMAATGITAGSYLRPSLTVAGAFTAYADADSANSFKPVVGRFQRYTTTSALFGWGWVNFTGVGSGSK